MNWGTPFEIYIRVPRERLSHSPGNAEGQSLVVSPDFRQHGISVAVTLTRTSQTTTAKYSFTRLFGQTFLSRGRRGRNVGSVQT